jgi:hypothetical protein
MERPAHQPALNHALAVAAGGTFALELLTLHLVGRVFTGGWLGSHVLATAGERVGLVASVLLYSVAVPGVLLAILVPLLARLRIPRIRAIWSVSLGWLLLLLVVAFLRMKIGLYVRDAMDLDLVRRLGGGTILGAFRYVLTWFWQDTLYALAGLILTIVVVRRVIRRVRGRDLGATRLGRIPRRPVRVLVGLSALFVLLEATVLGAAWPTVTWAMGRSTVGSLARTAVATASDLDGDGVGAFDVPPDQAPFDASRHPYAADVPGNGIDENGLLGDLTREDLPDGLRRAGDARRDYPRVRFTRRRNVVLVFLESVRHDAIGSEQNGRPLTPVLDELISSGEALRISGAWATIGYTAPALSQAFWGGYAERERTLLHELRDENGYWCGTASGQREDWDSIETVTGLVQCDFLEDSRMEDAAVVYGGVRTADRVLASVDRFLESRPTGRPFFLYANLQDCHFPYNLPNDRPIWPDQVPEPSLTRSAAPMLRRCYANQVAIVDRAVGRLRDRLVQAGVWEETTLILVSDHGESIYEDGVLGHGLRITDSQTRLACVVIHPVADLVEPFTLVDVRGLVRSQLTAPETAADPVVRREPDRRVLQVLGVVDRPRRIGHVGADGRRVLYDLHRGVGIDGETGETCRPDSGRSEEAELAHRVRALIRHWEYERWLMTVGETTDPRDQSR